MGKVGTMDKRITAEVGDAQKMAEAAIEATKKLEEK